MGDKKENDSVYILAIVGCGPRGLSALESVYGGLASEGKPMSLNTVLFEDGELPGAGHVYATEQPDTNWLNVSERGLTIPSRAEIRSKGFRIPAFPSYQEWAGYDTKRDSGEKPDQFPLRSTLGRYLNERFESIAAVLKREGLLEVIRGEVVATDWEENRFSIALKDGAVYHSDELVLTIGHQPTKYSDQISKWLAYSDCNAAVDLKTNPYPVQDILKSEVLTTKSSVGLRGFGLAMIDVMRALTTGVGGKFEVKDEKTQQMQYWKSGKEPAKIVPFSLDGLPMAPKPLNLKIDEWFFPTASEKEAFYYTVSSSCKAGTATDIHFLVDAITPIIARVFKSLGGKAYPCDLAASELQKVIRSWLFDGGFEHALIVPTSREPEEIIADFVGMANGTKPISLDFCIGHVWRHCQPTLYKAVSFSNLDDAIVAEVIQLDERLKRYSYGPPIASLQQLLALIKADVVTLNFVNDPEIQTMKSGWQLSKGKEAIIVDLMVNSVIDSPKLLEINSPIVRNLLQASLVKPVHGELGIETFENGCVSLPEELGEIPLAVLGRLSKGTLVGVDAILECFGVRSDLWAEGVVARCTG